MTLAQDISSSRTKALVGKRVDVLIESEEPGENTEGDLFSIGRSFRDAPEVDGMAFVKGVFQPGDIVPTIVKGSLPYDLLCYPA
jgi:ribosomal protein S12 methylthiotransferase